MDFDRHFEEARRHVANILDSRADNVYLAPDPEAEIEALLSNYALPEIEKDASRVVETRLTERILIYYPVVPDDGLTQVLRMRPSPQVLDPLELRYEHGWVVVTCDAGPGEIDRAVEKLEQKEIARRNANIRDGLAQLKVFISERFHARRGRAVGARRGYEEIVAGSRVPIRMRESGMAQMVTLTARRRVPRPSTIPSAPSRQVVLEQADLREVHRVIELTGLLFERTPGTFGGLGEEGLRNVILSNLNSVFVEGATGETFSKRGDTDIYLRISEGGIFIAECKFWNGIVHYTRAVEQMFGYLTWRETYGTMICFVRTREMSRVIETVRTSLGLSPIWLSEESSTHLVSKHAHPEDGSRTVVVHHLFFNLATE
jgi:hypothetical protein